MSELAIQQSLPGMDMRPLCPVCERPASVFGQWSPFAGKYICRDCARMLPFPADALEWDAQGELVFRADASRRQREIISVGSGELRSLAPSWRKEKRYRIAQLSEAWRFQQTPFPECLRCKSMNGYPYCQRCEDEMNVEGVYRIWRAGMREEWGEESEDVLDVLFNKIKSLKDVFDRGVLPDYWFRLVQANSK